MKMYSMENYYVKGKVGQEEEEEEEEEEEYSSYEEVEEKEEEAKKEEAQEGEVKEEGKKIAEENIKKEDSSYEEYSSDENEQSSKQKLQLKKQMRTRPYSGKLSVKDFSKVCPQQQKGLPSLLKQYSISNLEKNVIKRDIYHTRLLNQNLIKQKLNVFAKPEPAAQISRFSLVTNAMTETAKEKLEQSKTGATSQQLSKSMEKKAQIKQEQQEKEEKAQSPKSPLKPRPANRKCLPSGNANEVLLNDYEKDDPGKPIKQLSIFGKRPEENQLPTMIPERRQRPYSAIVSRITMEELHNEQLKEIQAIKERLAKEKINVGMDILTKGLLMSEGFGDDENLKTIPVSGTQLIENIYAQKKKKKKKKKKKH